MIVGTTGLVACSEISPVESSDTLIHGGTQVVGTNWSSSVALSMGGGLCTGTAVTPNLVITAAHCLDSLSPNASVTVTVGNRVNGGATYRSRSFKINPAYRDDAVTDIAYVVTSEAMQGIEFVQVLTDPQEIGTLLAPGAASTLVGFGMTERGQLGTKYEVTTQVGQNVAGALFIGGGGKDSCQGDSGGPAYGRLPDGQWRVYGITSRGNGCGGGGLLARMHDGLCWIQQDSGIVVPGSKLKCDGVANIPGPNDNGTAPSLALEDTSDDRAKVGVAAPLLATKVGLCFGDSATCRASKTIDLAFEASPKVATDRAFFVSKSPLALTEGLVVTILAFDGSNTLISTSTARLERK